MKTLPCYAPACYARSMKFLPALVALALASCDKPADLSHLDPAPMLRENAELKKKVAALEKELAHQRESPKIPTDREAAIRLTRLGIDPEDQDPRQFHEDQSWLVLNIFHPLRKVYDDKGQTEVFDDWRRPTQDEIMLRVQERERKDAAEMRSGIEEIKRGLKSAESN